MQLHLLKTGMAALLMFCIGASPVFVTSTRSIIERIPSYVDERPYRNVLPTQTREFDNGNTGAWFYQSVLGYDFEILIPSAFNADELMEALIKIRTAYAQGAKRVTVVSEIPLDDIEFLTSQPDSKRLPLEKLFQIAGASNIRVGGKPSVRLVRESRGYAYQDWSNSAFMAGDSHPYLRDELARLLKINVVDAKHSRYFDRTQIFYVASITPPVNENFFKLLADIIDLKSKGASVTLITPYLPYARSDKKDHEGVSVTGRLVADLIEAVRTDSIAFVRAHAPQSEGFFSIPVFHISGRRTLKEYLAQQGIDLVVSPDAGFQKDATLYAEDLGVPVAVVNKQRDPETSETLLHDISGPAIKGLHVAIIDDETASGSTLAKVAAFLKEHGAKTVTAVVSHLAGAGKKALESRDIDHIVVTNTFPVDTMNNGRVRVLSIAKEIAHGLIPLRNSVIRKDKCGSVFDN